MSGERFTLDTNILIYHVDTEAGDRYRMAREIVQRAARGPCRLTVQALSEFYAVMARKRWIPMAEVAMQVEDWLELFPCDAATGEAVRVAMRLAREGRASYWDGLLVATAEAAGCSAILTENMADGSALTGVHVVNPFGANGLTPAALAILAGQASGR